MSEPAEKPIERIEDSSGNDGKTNDSLVGVLLDSRYKITALLGSGATGSVYKAIDNVLLRDVAVKIIHSHLLFSQKSVERFKAEAATTTALSHPNIARVYTQGIASDGRFYMIMDCLEGESLAKVIARDGKIEFNLFFDLFLQLIDALSYAHAAGVVHRDIKPNNIIVVQDGPAKKAVIVDFGLAKWIEQDSAQGVTQTASILGSSAYMSPEQCLGLADLDSRADIYSFGCVMLECLMGRSPFEGSSAFDLMYKHLNESLGQLGFLKEIPESLSNIIEKCLQKDRTQRYQSMNELKVDFSKCSDMRDTLKRRWQSKLEMKGKKPLLIGVSAAALILILPALHFLQSEQIKNAKRKELEFKNAGNKDKDLLPPEQAKVPLDDRSFSAFVRRYRDKMGNEAVLELLKNWERKHSKHAGLDDRVSVWGEYATTYAAMGNNDQAEIYAKKVFASNMPRHASVVASILAKRYSAYAAPDKGIALIEAVMRRYKGQLQPDDLMNLEGTEGQCFMRKCDFKQACLHFALANEVSEKAGVLNVWVYPYINCLYLLGRKQEVSGLLVPFEKRLIAEKGRSYPDKVGDAYFELAKAFFDAGDLSEGARYFQKSMDEYNAVGREGRADQAELMIAAIDNEKLRYKAALEIYQRVLAHKKAWWDKSDILQAMADVEYHLNNEAESLRYARQALDICMVHLSSSTANLSSWENLKVAPSINCCCFILAHQGRRSEAGEIWANVLRDLESNSKHSVALAIAYGGAAEFMAAQGSFSPALADLEKEIAILLESEFQNRCIESKINCSELLANAYKLKARILECQSKLQGAYDSLKKSLAYLDKVDYSQGNRIYCLLNLLRLSDQLGLKEQCDEYCAMIEPLWRSNFSSWAHSDLSPIIGLADFKRSKKEYASAERIYRECIDGLTATYAADHEPLRPLLKGLAQTLFDQKKLEEAIIVAQRAVSISRRAQKKDSECLEDLSILFELLLLRKDHKEAEKIAKEMIAVGGKPGIARAYYNLSRVYVLSSKPAQRIASIEKGYQLICQSDKPNATNLCQFETELSELYKSSSRLDDAERMAQAAIRDAQKMPPEPADLKESCIARAYEDLALVKDAQQDYHSALENHDASAKYYEALGKNYLAQLRAVLSKRLESAKAAHLQSEIRSTEDRLKKLSSG